MTLSVSFTSITESEYKLLNNKLQHKHGEYHFFSTIDLLCLMNNTPTRTRRDDCVFCRITGTAVGLGAGYIALNKSMQLQKTAGITNKAVGLGVAGVVFTSAGLYRLLFY